jgi:antagonist of KipI
MITVTRAPPYLTVQDTGRTRARSSGVPRAGAMDRFALEALNALVGNPPGSAGLEWALGAGTLRFGHSSIIAFGGAIVAASLRGKASAAFTTLRAEKGDELDVQEFRGGRFLYIAIGGGIDVPEILGSRATYLPGRFGGLVGRTVVRGDILPVGEASMAVPAAGFTPDPKLLPRYESGGIRVTPGTHADILGDLAWQTFTTSSFTVGVASDRTGYKLTGPAIPGAPSNLPSDAGCEGVVQLPSDGAPIVLMADAPTVGGYAKIAVIADADLSVLAQRTPGETVRFRPITVEESQRALRERALDLKTIRSAGAASA